MFRDYQAEVDKIHSQYPVPYWNPLEILCRLTEETGEVARMTNHLFGAKKKKNSEPIQHLEDELIDVMYTVICYANSQRINLDEAWRRKVDAQLQRDATRFKP